MPLNPNSYGSASGWAMIPGGAGTAPSQTQPPPQPTPAQPPPQQQDWRQKVSAFMQSIGVPTDEMKKFMQFMYSEANPGVVQNVKNAYAPAPAAQPPPQQAQSPTINTRMTPEQIAAIVGNNPGQ